MLSSVGKCIKHVSRIARKYLDLFCNVVLLLLKLRIEIFGIEFGEFEFTHYFELKWYAVVGSTLITTAAMNMFISPGFEIMYYLIGIAQRNVQTKWFFPKHQDDLNKLFTLPQFRSAERYAECLSMILLTVSFSAGLPLLTPFAAIFFAITYWVDKTILLKGSCRPAMVDQSTAMQS